VEKFLSVKEKVGEIDRILEKWEEEKENPDEVVRQIRQISATIIEEM